MNRAFFLRRSAIATLGLLTGDAALEAFERLTYRRRYWPGADLSGWTCEPVLADNISVGRNWYYSVNSGPWKYGGAYSDDGTCGITLTADETSRAQGYMDIRTRYA